MVTSVLDSHAMNGQTPLESRVITVTSGKGGVGKTTLFRMIVGQEQPDAGTIRVGETVKLGYVDQNRPLDPEKTVWEEISGGDE